MQPCPTFRDSLYTISMYPYTGLVYYSQKDQLPRAPSVSRRNSTRVGEGGKGWSHIAIKVKVTNPWRGGERRAWNVTTDLSYDYLFERSEFLIDTSQKKSLRGCRVHVCTRAIILVLVCRIMYHIRTYLISARLIYCYAFYVDFVLDALFGSGFLFWYKGTLLPSSIRLKLLPFSSSWGRSRPQTARKGEKIPSWCKILPRCVQLLATPGS